MRIRWLRIFHKNRPLNFLILSCILLGLLLFFYPKNQTDKDYLTRKIIIKNKVFELETVYSIEKKALGLGGRDGICEYCGMLFDFSGSEKGEHVFWMKGMRFDLDILWLDEGRVVWVEKNVKLDNLNKMGKGIVSDAVIEISSGMAEKLGIEIGEKISL